MILGLGIDTVEIARLQGALDRFGESFLKRVLLPDEITYCLAHPQPAPYVAVRFAAKEAISKAFGTGIGAELSWLDLEVRRNESGAPHVVLRGGGEKLFQARHASQLHISLSHSAHYATAVAILEG